LKASDESQGVKVRHKNAMNEIVSFIGGVAISGLAALFLLRGGGLATSSAPIAPLPQPSSIAPVPAPIPAPVPVAPSPSLSPSPDRSDALKNELDSFKVQAERQKLEIDQLKYAQQQLQGQVQLLATQAKAGIAATQTVDAAGNPVSAVPRGGVPVPQETHAIQQEANPIFTGAMWAVGGVLLCLTGGNILVLIISALSRQQSRGMRGKRMMEPMDGYPSMPYRKRYVLPREEQMPIPMERVRQVDYEEYESRGRDF
jgi:hypothetical protein